MLSSSYQQFKIVMQKAKYTCFFIHPSSLQ